MQYTVKKLHDRDVPGRGKDVHYINKTLMEVIEGGEAQGEGEPQESLCADMLKSRFT